MDSTRWERMQSLFHEAADLPLDARDAFLRTACAGDEALFADVAAMLNHDAGRSALLDGDIADMAGRVIGERVPEALANRMFGRYRLTRPLKRMDRLSGVRDDPQRAASDPARRVVSPARRNASRANSDPRS
jgi:hypothetical protein